MKVAAWIILTEFPGGRMASVPSRVSLMGMGDLSASRKPLTSPAKGMEWTVPAATERKTR